MTGDDWQQNVDVRPWMRSARPGYCNITSAASDSCETGAQGSWSLRASPLALQSWETAAAACLERCAECSNCRYISLSLTEADCSWYRSCNLSDLKVLRRTGRHRYAGRQVPSFRSGRAPEPLRRSTADHQCRASHTRPRRLWHGGCVAATGSGRWLQLLHPRQAYVLDSGYLPAFNESRWFWARCRANGFRSKLTGRASIDALEHADSWEWRPDASCLATLAPPASNHVSNRTLDPLDSSLAIGVAGQQVAHSPTPATRRASGPIGAPPEPSVLTVDRETFVDAFAALLPLRPHESALPGLGAAFCRQHNWTRVLFVGDSMSGQMFTSFVHLLGAWRSVDLSAHPKAAACAAMHMAGGSHEIVVQA